MPMKRLLTAVLSVLLASVPFAACGSSGSSTASPTTAGATATSRSTAGTTVPATTAASGTSASAFCTMLAGAVDHTKALAGAIGTPDLPAKLAAVKADNDAIMAAAPAEVKDAVATVYQVAEKGQAALDPSLSPTEKQAASAAALAASRAPETKTASTTFQTWVRDNCGPLTSKILAGM